ncbi:hypothetical protein JCM19294_1158 [Nonlabens tegetincola]|uniref:Uncharacterized protein n=1 Tax=Nonlabens tegetincola TaxID=323273 RepID=A0A090Q183_9FLAO|nr:hypothetical protein [Nonlabens tegetincola]GAK96849.1 hypothetical protein JCM19294_1158 [Nonlabens tegetincola]
MSEQVILKDIYQVNSDINRITAQLKVVNDNPERYEKDVNNLSRVYLKQLRDKATQLKSLTNLISFSNNG